MAHQMRHFRQVFHEVMEFTMAESPFDCMDDPLPSLKHFLPRKPGARFKSWLQFHGWMSEEAKKTSSPDCVFGLETIVEYLIDKLRSPEGPFDGVLCFS